MGIRKTTHAAVLILPFITVALHPGCSSPIAPPPLAQIQSSAPPPAPDAPTTESREPYAVVTIEQASVREHPPTATWNYYWYDVRFLIRETGGRAGAQIEMVSLAPGMSRDLTPVGCWTVLPYVPAGGTFDVFYTDEGIKWLGYCAPGISSKTPLESVRVIVGFEDNDNREGTVEAVIPVRASLP